MLNFQSLGSVSQSMEQYSSHPLPVLDKKRTNAYSLGHERTIRLRKKLKETAQQQHSSLRRNNKKQEDIKHYIQQIYKLQDKKKKIIISPSKACSPDYILYQIQQYSKQLERMKTKMVSSKTNKQNVNNSPFPFETAETKDHKIKKSPNKKTVFREKLKPISESSFKKDHIQFLSIQKMNIQQNDSKTVCKKNQTFDQQENFVILPSFSKYKKKSESKNDLIELANEENNTFLSEVCSPCKGQVCIYQEKVKSFHKKKSEPKNIKKGQIQSPFRLTKHPISEVVLRNTQFIEDEETKVQQKLQKQKINVVWQKKKKNFNPPFQTYHYRSLIWKMNLSNKISIEIPQQYDHRLKVYIGKGNNSGLVRGLIKRRIWFATTQRIQQANFVWVQLKNLSYFKTQKNWQPKQRQIDSQDKYLEKSLFTQKDKKKFKAYLDTYLSTEERTDQRFLFRSKQFKYETIIKIPQIRQIKMQNHLINNYVIGNKKALFHTMLSYYTQINKEIFDHLPLTFHVKNGLEDEQYARFLKMYYKQAKEAKNSTSNKNQHNAWIVKPGQNSNRGNGIQVCLTLDQIKSIVKKKQKYADGSPKTFIIQSYIQHPLLYKKRKFDIRHYIMITCINGFIKGYWYQDGYVRTTSSEYSLKSNNGKVHLTNDAVQKLLPDYGKYEKGNKLSYDQLNAYMQKKFGKQFYVDIYPKMKKTATDTMRACSGTIDPDKKQNNFEIFGLDFMIDADFNVWLIEVNSNPCLEISCPLLGSIIPRMLQNAFELTLDAAFPPPVRYFPKGVHYFKNLQQENRFELVYDERLQKIYKSENVLDAKLLLEQDDVFQDDGEQWDQDD